MKTKIVKNSVSGRTTDLYGEPTRSGSAVWETGIMYPLTEFDIQRDYPGILKYGDAIGYFKSGVKQLIPSGSAQVIVYPSGQNIKFELVFLNRYNMGSNTLYFECGLRRLEATGVK